MENVERGCIWQATTRTIRNRLQHVLDSPAEFPPDIYFEVGLSDEQQEKIGAHKLILAAGSEVLYAMLLGPVAEKELSIRIPDLYPAAFRQMLMFLYTDKITLNEESDSEIIWLAFRTMECARKYDIPELYFACRSCVVELLDRDHPPGVCGTILIEAYGIGDSSLVDTAYYSFLKHPCCQLDELDLKSVSFGLLCHLLERNETGLCEEDLYSLCLRWAKIRSGEDASPSKLKKVMGKARYLIRFAEMDPSAVADGPSKDKILSSDEVRLVYQKQFGSSTNEHYPFKEGKRRLYMEFEWMTVGASRERRMTDRTVRFPIKHVARGRSLLNDSFLIEFRPEMSMVMCCRFLRLCNMKYPFELCVGNENLVPTNTRPVLSDEQKQLAEAILQKPVSPGSSYVSSGDIALAMGNSGYLELRVAARPGFKPAGWIVVGRMGLADELDLLSAILNMNNRIRCLGPVNLIEDG